jgi:hypothetical protein
LWIKSLLGVLEAQVGVPKLPRHAQDDQTARAGPTTDTTATTTFDAHHHFHPSRVGASP